MAAAKRTRPARPRRPKAAKDAVQLVPFTASFVENERAGLRCSCAFPDKCDGSRLIHCSGLYSSHPVACECEACPADVAEHVTGCQGCDECNKAECGTCGTRSETETADADAVWYCSPECSRKAFTVAS